MVRKILIPFCLLLALLSGCRSDEPFGPDPTSEETGVRLLIPSATMARETATRTRAFTNHSDNYDILEAEGKINNIHVFGFRQNGDNTSTPAFYRELTEDMGTPVNDIYRSYNISTEVGTYNIYILTNTDLPSTLRANPGTATESAVKDANHTALVGKADGVSSFLPMSGTATCEVRPKATATAYANLSFLHSKVRLTVINEKGWTESAVRFDNLRGSNLFKETRIFGTNNTSSADNINRSEQDGIASFSRHYDFDKAAEKYPSLMNLDVAGNMTALMESEISTFPLDKLGEEEELPSTDDSTCKFIYQTICYPAESLGAAEQLRTVLDMIYHSGTETGNLTFKLGDDCDGTPYDRTKGGKDLKRGHFYDIVVSLKEGGEVLVYWDIKEWQIDRINIQLAGLTDLFLQKTVITETMDGETIESVPFTTNAPRLALQSSVSEYTDAAGDPIPYFILTENRTDNSIKVRINPALPVGEYENKTFTVTAGNVTKTVTVKKIALSKYLNIYPSSQTVNIQQIVNESTYDFYFEFSTNADNLVLRQTAFANANTRKGYTAPTGSATIGRGLYLQVCGADTVAISPKIDMSDFLNGSAINLGDRLNADMLLPNSGILRISIEDPSQAEYFSKEISGTFTATADGVAAKTARFTVKPNPTVYTLHFKAINPDGNWSQPHVYVYQPLEYKGDLVYGYDGKKTLNWIEYSFTGNRAFRGWQYQQGGEPDLTGYSINDNISFGGSIVSGYDLGSDWGDPNYLTDAHYNEVQFFDKEAMACDICQNALDQTWPGCCMTEEDDGWWKIELPLLAKPDKAMVMFVGGHGDGNGRYPGDGIPGIPLPNYSDRESWYLYDGSRGGDNCSFSDDRRDSYASDPVVVENEEYYVISWPTSYYDRLLMCGDGQSLAFGDWNAVKGATSVKNGLGQQIGSYYYVWAPSSSFTNGQLNLTQGYEFIILNSNGNKTNNVNDNIKFDSSHVQEITLSTADKATLEAKISSTEGSAFEGIVKIFRITSYN